MEWEGNDEPEYRPPDPAAPNPEENGVPPAYWAGGTPAKPPPTVGRGLTPPERGEHVRT